MCQSASIISFTVFSTLCFTLIHNFAMDGAGLPAPGDAGLPALAEHAEDAREKEENLQALSTILLLQSDVLADQV